jgi:TolA-binding protein
MTQKEQGKAVEPIPEWIINYDKAGHQSSAGKAIRFLMEQLSQAQEEIKDLQAENARLRIDLKAQVEQTKDWEDTANDRTSVLNSMDDQLQAAQAEIKRLTPTTQKGEVSKEQIPNALYKKILEFPAWLALNNYHHAYKGWDDTMRGDIFNKYLEQFKNKSK